MHLELFKNINSLSHILAINPIELGENINLGLSLNVIIILLVFIIMIFLGSALFSQKK